MSEKRQYTMGGFIIDRLLEFHIVDNDVIALEWFEKLVRSAEGKSKDNVFMNRTVNEKPGFNIDRSTGIKYWADKIEASTETVRYYMVDMERMKEDLRYITVKDPRIWSGYFEHLSGKVQAENKPPIYPLTKIVRHTGKEGKRTFFYLNHTVVDYLRGRIDSMNDLFDDKVQPVENLPKKEYGPLSEEFLSFYRKACKVYDFKHRLPKDGEAPTATLAKAQEYFEAILANNFKPKLKKPCDVDLSDASPKLILKALMRYVGWMEVNRPKEKISLDTFFYNPKQMMSYFLVNYSMDSLDRKENQTREDNREFLDTSDDPYFDDLYDELCQRSSYTGIYDDKVVHNSFYRFYRKIEADSDKFDRANLHCKFLERCFWPEFIENTYWKETLVADDFNMESKRSAKFVRALERRGYKVFMDKEDHEENERLWQDALARDRAKGEDVKKARNLNKSLDELDAVEVELTQDEKAVMREEKRKQMLQMLGMMSDDVFFLDNHMNTSYDEVEAMYKKAGGDND